MPVVTHHTTALVLPSSPPSSPTGRTGNSSSVKQTINVAAASVAPAAPSSLLWIPLELKNGCSEANLKVQSDDITLTNRLRKHYLQHFGHRDLEAMVQEYCPQAVIVHKHNCAHGNNSSSSGSDNIHEQDQQQQHQPQPLDHRSSFHGHDEIRSAFLDMFALHPEVNSTMELQEIVVEGRTARVTWKATTPTHTFDNVDTFQFLPNGKIAKQVVACPVCHLQTPWYVTDE